MRGSEVAIVRSEVAMVQGRDQMWVAITLHMTQLLGWTKVIWKNVTSVGQHMIYIAEVAIGIYSSVILFIVIFVHTFRFHIQPWQPL